MIKKEWDLGDNIGKVYESVRKKLSYAGYQLEERDRTIINLDTYEVTVLCWALSSYFQKKEDSKIMPLICLRCKKDIPLPYGVMDKISYTHYSYCEDCLRKGLKALRAIDEIKEV